MLHTHKDKRQDTQITPIHTKLYTRTHKPHTHTQLYKHIHTNHTPLTHSYTHTVTSTGPTYANISKCLLSRIHSFEVLQPRTENEGKKKYFL